MYTKPVLLWLAIFFASYINAQNFSTESLGKAGASVADHQLNSIFNNPAGTAYLSSISINAQYLLPYQLTELSTKQLGVVFPTEFGVFSGLIKQYGFRLYNENTFSLMYSRRFGQKFSAAFQLNFQQINLTNDNSSSQIYSALGINYSITKSLFIGLHLINTEGAKISIGEQTYKIPSFFIYGFKWEATKDFSLSTEIEKEADHASVYKLGLEYKPFEVLSIRTGFKGKPVQYCLGAGVNISGVNINAAVSHHPTLGMSSSVGLSYQFKNRQ